MKSVADQLAREVEAQVLSLNPDQRVALALRLGADAVRLYAQTHGVSLAEAGRVLRINNQRGRRESRALSEET